MKPSIIRIILFIAAAIAFPVILVAGEKINTVKTEDQKISKSDLAATTIFQKDGQDKKSKGKNSRDKKSGVQDEKPKDTKGKVSKGKQKPAIKQVPRSIPKLKPKAVKDRIPIRRIPVKIPKKGIKRIGI